MNKATEQIFTERIYNWITNDYVMYNSILDYTMDCEMQDTDNLVVAGKVAQYIYEVVENWALGDGDYTNTFTMDLITDYLAIVDFQQIAKDFMRDFTNIKF